MKLTKDNLDILTQECQVRSKTDPFFNDILEIISGLRTAQVALVEAAIPLEVLTGQIKMRPYDGMSPALQEGILGATIIVRAACKKMVG